MYAPHTLDWIQTQYEMSVRGTCMHSQVHTWQHKSIYIQVYRNAVHPLTETSKYTVYCTTDSEYQLLTV